MGERPIKLVSRLIVSKMGSEQGNLFMSGSLTSFVLITSLELLIFKNLSNCRWQNNKAQRCTHANMVIVKIISNNACKILNVIFSTQNINYGSLCMGAKLYLIHFNDTQRRL